MMKQTKKSPRGPRPSRRYKYPYLNPDLPVEERIDDLLSRMTLEEKIHSLGSFARVPRLGLHGINHVEGLHGLALGGPGNWGRPTPIPTTTFCQAIGLGETWDPDAVKQVAEVEAEEVRYCYQSPKYQRGGLVVRAPNADVGRDIRWGRTEECYGEDAWFNGTMTVAFVKGLQGDHPRYWKTASLMKHFCANSNEDTREHSSSDFDARLLHEYYSLPFRMGVMEGGSRAYMAAYNCVNGIPCTVHPMLKDITVKQWGQDGIICTDGGALRLLISAHKYYPTLAQGAAWSVKMGISQFLDRHTEATQEAIAKDYLTEADIDASLRGNFRVMIKLGILDPEDMVPYRKIGTGPEPWTTEKHKALAREVTRKSIVLLKNRDNLLPLDRKTTKSIAVVGLYADRVFLDWYSGTPPYTVSPLEGIRSKAGSDISVSYAPDNTNDAAMEFAKSADVAIVIVGNHPTCNAGWAKTLLPSDGKEAVDRKSITLEHEELIKQVAKVNPRTIVVLVSSFPYAINWTQQNVPAILHMTHNSQETGNALADVLFGDYNPAGRLVQTWPKSIDQLPELMQYNIRNGRTYMYFKGEPLYPFGFGLSYTTFAYSNPRLGSKKLRAGADGTMTLKVDITNTGQRDGEEVVQVYAKYLASSVERPNRQLVAFKRIPVRKGQTRTVQLRFAASQLAYWDNAKKSFIVEPGRLQLLVGASSADIRQTAEVDIG